MKNNRKILAIIKKQMNYNNELYEVELTKIQPKNENFKKNVIEILRD